MIGVGSLEISSEVGIGPFVEFSSVSDPKFSSKVFPLSSFVLLRERTPSSDVFELPSSEDCVPTPEGLELTSLEDCVPSELVSPELAVFALSEESVVPFTNVEGMQTELELLENPVN